MCFSQTRRIDAVLGPKVLEDRTGWTIQLLTRARARG
jgi:hypothetical protein